MTTGAGETPGPFLVSRHPLFRGDASLLAVSGSSRGWPARVSSSPTWEARMWSAIAGAQGTGACSRLSPPVPGPHGGSGHTCRFHLRGPAPLAASPMPPVSESGKVLAELAVPIWAWEADTHARTKFHYVKDGHIGALLMHQQLAS